MEIVTRTSISLYAYMTIESVKCGNEYERFVKSGELNEYIIVDGKQEENSNQLGK